jgi:catechol 2,3-dioxygenase-like lactoylglutathione lyase family enzyme
MGNTIGLAHLAFNVSNIENSLDFYCGKLGLKKAFVIFLTPEIIERLPQKEAFLGKKIPWITYLEVAKGQFIELFAPMPGFEYEQGVSGFRVLGFTHLSLQVKDIKGYIEDLRKKGVTIDDEVKWGELDNTWQAWISDPDGNKIEVMEYTETSLQVIYESQQKMG